MDDKYDLSQYKEVKEHRLKRIVWAIVNATLFKWLYGLRLHGIRNVLLRMFGGQVPYHTLVYSSVRIYAPWNLKVGLYSCIGPNVEIYNKAVVSIGDHVVVSQDAYICTASHDISSSVMSLVTKPVTIESKSWIAAKAIILPGVTVAEGAVVGCAAVVTRDVESRSVVAGNPAREVKKRYILVERD